MAWRLGLQKYRTPVLISCWRRFNTKSSYNLKLKLFIHAINVHQSGGRTLLNALIAAIPIAVDVQASLDNRMPIPHGIHDSIKIKKVMPTIIDRFRAEWQLARTVASGDLILCFSSLPPLFKLRGHVVVFVQNRYLVDDVVLDAFPLRVRLRLFVERLWLFKKIKNADELIVQTSTMKRLLETKTQGIIPIRILPFVAESAGYTRISMQSNSQKELDSDFVYVASGEPHKNHARLIEAWCLLANENLFPSLCLTLNVVCFSDLCETIEKLKQKHGLKISNVGELVHSDVLMLYARSGAAIYPSTFESFGLPLIEARQAGLPVLASELDYVRDVLDPEQVFDPSSAVSIARAVKRFMGMAEQPLPLLSATEFLDKILAKAK